MEKELQTISKGEGSSSSKNDAIWKALWQFKVPNTGRCFCRKVAITFSPPRRPYFANR
jgi:hypothetical protein